MPSATKVLIVDDNEGYRQAFGRNLTLKGYEVAEASDGASALEALQSIAPDVVVTDLAMGHPTEGLDLIRQLRTLEPHLPVIMISAVGTFDEGAEAMRLGAVRVISKSRIDEEIAGLYEAIDAASDQYAASCGYIEELEALAAKAPGDPAATSAALNEMMKRDEVSASVKSEIFDLLANLDPGPGGGGTDGDDRSDDPSPMAGKESADEAERRLTEEIPGFASFGEDTRKNLVSAEVLYRQSQRPDPEVDFSRSMGFAFCFAVENEAKGRLRKKMQKFFGDPATPKLVGGLLEENGRSLSIFFQQYLLRIQREAANEATMENFFFTFRRILEHRGKYRPDGLKALGIVLICFGRSFSFRKFNRDVAIDNPMGLKGFDSPDDILRFASLLINLQHYRNPYIHPELSEMTKISKIRETAFACLNHLAAIR